MTISRTNAVKTATVLFLGTCLLYSVAGQAAPDSKEVEVINDASNPVLVEDVDNPARQPFSTRVSFDNAFNPVSVVVTTVPSDSRLVIEFLTVVCSSTAGIEPTVVQVFAGALHSFTIENKPFGTGFSSVSTHLTRMYAEPNSDVTANVFPTTIAPLILCDIAITGYFVEL